MSLFLDSLMYDINCVLDMQCDINQYTYSFYDFIYYLYSDSIQKPHTFDFDPKNVDRQKSHTIVHFITKLI